MEQKKIIKWLGSLAAAASLIAAPLAQAEEEIVIGGSIPMTGVFAFAGIGIHAGITDY
ncbi:MAG: amino acid/amide transporter substrate-binding protein family, partial [Proteobacteria bacterium]|nr:amino acid/amide transporter substrate-binding protein family [Pseudomonadota bacterium]